MVDLRILSMISGKRYFQMLDWCRFMIFWSNLAPFFASLKRKTVLLVKISLWLSLVEIQKLFRLNCMNTRSYQQKKKKNQRRKLISTFLQANVVTVILCLLTYYCQSVLLNDSNLSATNFTVGSIHMHYY
jgi:hypothetical protein